MTLASSLAQTSATPLYLCATTRLAQTLRAQPPVAVAAVWRTAQALTINQWLQQLSEEALLTGLADLPPALDPYAERLLWEQVVADGLSQAAGAAAPLFDLPGMAASAVEAQKLTRLWPVLQAALNSESLAEEGQLFCSWQSEFVRRCRAQGWIDAAGWQRAVLDLLATGNLSLPAAVILVGFDRLTPLETDLLAILAAQGVRVEQRAFPAPHADLEQGEAGSSTVHPSAQPKTGHLYRAADAAAECAAAVAWAAERLAAFRKAGQACRIGIVAPHLADVRERLEALLDDALHPQALHPAAAEQPRCYNFSLGRPLAAQPVVATALDLLALAGLRGKVEQGRFARLLLATAWAGDVSEADARACLEAALRRELGYFTNWSAVLRLLERQGVVLPLPVTSAALHALATAGEHWPRRQSPAAWAAAFAEVLGAVGWPGERPLSSHEFQARRVFSEVLAALSRLDEVLGPIDRATALRRLGELCRQRVFQPETRGQPVIQVLGVLESAGLQFDALWIMGMNDDQWPPAPRPNPLLPAAALRAAGAAHASAEVELDFAQRVQTRLLQAAPEVVLSWAQADGNRIRRPSPLLDLSWPLLPRVPVVVPLADQSAQQAGLACEQLADALAPPVASGERVAGGSSLLRAQAICPAWAFYQYRLQATALEEAVEGLDPAARGTLVHAALEAFWRTTSTAQALRAQTPVARKTAVVAACESALTTYETQQHQALPPRFRLLEAARLQRLLLHWLALEAERADDFSVLACEQVAEIEVEGIQVKMVVDRIDAVSGGQLIVDYKTGAAIDVKNWASARITEPQLPLYAALVADDVVAVAFAKVLPDKPAFTGVAASSGVLPGVPGLGDGKQRIFPAADFPDWSRVLEHWRLRLRAIACEIRAGEAGVVIADEKLLQYCEVKPLLRLPEWRRWSAAQHGAAVMEVVCSKA